MFVLVRYRCDGGDLRTIRLVAISGRILVMLGGGDRALGPVCSATCNMSSM